ncbi:hypothetical protein B0H16DRAFT_1500310, partial [Mycena metata]
MATPISRRLVAVRLWKLRSTFCIGIPLPGHTQHDFTDFLSGSLLVVTRNTCFSHPRNFELFCAGGIQRRRAKSIYVLLSPFDHLTPHLRSRCASSAVGPALIDAIMAEITISYSEPDTLCGASGLITTLISDLLDPQPLAFPGASLSVAIGGYQFVSFTRYLIIKGLVASN